MTGSDVSILNNNLIEPRQCKIKINKCNLKYLMEEKMLIN